MSIIAPGSLLSGIYSPASARKALAVPIGGITVTDSPYNAVDDGLGGFFQTTWTNASTTLILASGTCTVTVANTGPAGVAMVTIPGATSGNALGANFGWVNKPIAINGAGTAGGTLVAKVVAVAYDSTTMVTTAQLNIAAPVPITASSVSVLCPCFTSGSDGSGMATCVGRKIWVSGGSSLTSGTANPAVYAPILSTISAVVNPFRVTTADNFTASSVSALAGINVEWGTDNTAAVIAAAAAAINLGSDSIFLPGMMLANSTGKFSFFDYFINTGTQAAADRQAGWALSAVHWHTVNAVTRVIPKLGDGLSFQPHQLYKGGIPWTAGPPPAPKRSITALTQWPRLATLNAFVVLVVGDSWANGDPSGQGNAVWGPFAANLTKQNPGKTVYFVNTGISGLTWNGLLQTIATNATVTVDGLGTVTPDLVCLFVTGGNDLTAVTRNDIMSVINTVKGWTTKNGLAPDICLLTGTYPRTYDFFSANYDSVQVPHEYNAVFIRSLCRVRNYAFVDVARHAAYSLRGWSEDNLALRLVPPPAAATVTATAPQTIPYQCRDFFMAIQLGSSQTGAVFWAAAGTLQVSLSAKPDNRLYLSVDASNNLNVTAVTWGLAVTTPVTMTGGSASLTTSGQTTLTVTGAFVSRAPTFNTGGATTFVVGMVGQCYLAAGNAFYGNEDFRSYVMAFTNASIMFTADANDTSRTPSSISYGGQMFTAQDATAKADLIIAGAGAVTHPLTGASSLVTNVSAYTNFQSITAAAVNANATLTASSQKVFLGSISVGPTYNKAVAAGADAGTNQIITIRKSGTHVKVGYLPGAGAISDIRAAIQANEQLVWEGEVECFGGPYLPKIYAGASVTVQLLYLMVDDFNGLLRRPTMTMRQAFGTGDPPYSATPFGGDQSHPSQIFLANVIDEVTASQSLATPTNYANTYAVNTPTTGFSLTIPANQAFTELTPAGTLAAGTITLPSIFPLGGRLEVFSTQTVTALTVAAPSGFTLVGTAVTTIAANGTIAYRLIGTTWCRVA